MRSEHKEMNNQDHFDTLSKSVEDKVPNVTDEETIRKPLSGFLHTSKWRSLEPDVSP